MYNVGVYLRLSREDENKKNQESESIINQREYITNYLKENNYKLYDVYLDDGLSGTNFERPGFKRLINDIENKKINMVVTKDLSRLGRDHIETGQYLEKYFPAHGIRYVAISDGYDSIDQDSSSNDFAPFRNVFNDLYAKDISKKVRVSLKTKQLNGSFIGTYAPIGYKKDPNCKGKLIIDNENIHIVKMIFEKFINGYSLKNISDILYNKNIKSPSGKVKWSTTTIKRILINEVYIGNTVSNKVKKVNYKIKKQIYLPEDKWIKVENTHEKIISESDFNFVQNILKTKGYKKNINDEHLLSGLVFCNNCTEKYYYINAYSKNKFYLICRNIKLYGKKSGKCESKVIKEEILNRIVIKTINEVIQNNMDIDYIVSYLEKKYNRTTLKEIEYKMNEIGIKIECNKNLLFDMYKDKINNKINEVLFYEFKEKIVRENEINNRLIEDLTCKKELIKKNNCNDLKSRIYNFINYETKTRSIITQLINKIKVQWNGSKVKIIIEFKFKIN